MYTKTNFMEQNENLFGLNLDAQSKGYLGETAKWAKFLSIVGIIGCAFLILAGIMMAASGSELERAMRQYSNSSEMENIRMITAIAYIVIAVIYFFPCLYLMRFSNQMTTAMSTENQESLTLAFQNLKSTFKFIGIFTIVIIAIYILAIVVGVGSSM